MINNNQKLIIQIIKLKLLVLNLALNHSFAKIYLLKNNKNKINLKIVINIILEFGFEEDLNEEGIKKKMDKIWL